MNLEEENKALIERYLNGTATPEEVGRLGEGVRQDPELRLALFLAADQDATVRSLLAAEQGRVMDRPGGEPSDSEDAGGRRRPGTRRARLGARWLHSARPRTHWLWAGMVAACIFLTVVVVLTVSSPRPAAPRQTDAARLRVQTEEERRQESPARMETTRESEEAAERARAEQERLTRELAAMEARRRILEAARKKAEEEKQEEPRKKAEEDFARNVAEFKAAQEALARAREEERRAKENLARARPAGVPDTEKRETQAATVRATLERVEGQAFVLSAARRDAAKAGRSLLAGEGLETGSVQSRAVVRYEDGTLIELGPAGTIRGFGDRGGLGGIGKHVDVTRGVLKAEVARQPRGQALVIATPHGEATVLGTTLRIIVDPSWTRLEVTEGRVRLIRSVDGQGVDVPSGHFAEAPTGVDLAHWRIPPDEITINFGAAGMALPEEVWNDSGEEFDAKRGYGWKGPRGVKEIPGTFYIVNSAGRQVPFTPGVGKSMPAGFSYDIDPATGKPKLFRPNRGAGVIQNQIAIVGPLKASGIALGWINHAETWFMPVPNGRYLVTVCVGHATYEHGPHHVAIEGKQVVNKVLTKAGLFFEAKDVAVDVRDGDLTLVVGGYGSGPVSSDGSSDTILNSLVIKKANGK